MEMVLTANDKIWRAESDARTLAEADVIQKDKNRLKMAVKTAKKMADERMKEATSMKKVANKNTETPKKPVKRANKRSPKK